MFDFTKNQMIEIGYSGEYDVRKVEIDLAPFQKQFGDGQAVLVFVRHMGEQPTIVPTAQEDGVLTWIPGTWDMAKEGWGKLEIRWYVNGGLAKSRTISVKINTSIMADGEPPEGYIDWFEALTALDAHATEQLRQILGIEEAVFEEAAAVRKDISDAAAANRQAIEDVTALRNASVSDISNLANRSIENITKSNNDALRDIESERQKSVQKIESDKNTAVALIQAKREGAVGAVSDEKADALSRIGTKEAGAIQNIGNKETSALQNLETARSGAVKEVGDLKTGALSDIAAAKKEATDTIESDKTEAVDAIGAAKTSGLAEINAAANVQRITKLEGDVTATNESLSQLGLSVVNGELCHTYMEG